MTAIRSVSSLSDCRYLPCIHRSRQSSTRRVYHDRREAAT